MGWLNAIGLGIVIMLLIPNAIFAAENKSGFVITIFPQAHGQHLHPRNTPCSTMMDSTVINSVRPCQYELTRRATLINLCAHCIP